MTIEELLDEYYIKENEVQEKIAQVINESKLPAIILEPILKKYYDQIHEQKMHNIHAAYLRIEQQKKKKEENKNKDKKASK